MEACRFLGSANQATLRPSSLRSPCISLGQSLLLHRRTFFAGLRAGLLDSKIHCAGTDLNILALTNLPETFCKNVGAGGAPLLGIDEIPQRELHPIIGDLEEDHRLNFKARHHKDALHFLDLRFGIVHEFARVFAPHSLQHLRRACGVTGIGEGQLNFIPYVSEIAGVIENGSAKHLCVGELDDAAAVLVAANPVPDFHHARIEKADVDNVAAQFINFNAVAHGVHVSKEDGDASGNAQQWFTQSHRQPCSD